MIVTRGRVVSIRAEEALVSLPAPEGCGKCGSRGGCAGARERIIHLPAEGLHAGDEVTLTTSEGALHRGVLTAYVMPAVAIIVGAVAGQILYGTDEAAVAGAGLGLAAGLVLLRLLGRSAGAACSPATHFHHGASHD
jgi:sigma-E factor negative regulatory protein RseC